MPHNPHTTDVDVLNIQDLLLLENRDRIYDPDVYVMRGVYNTQDVDFDLTQFGLFLNNDTIFMTFHYNTMIDTFGRKLMNGDVIEIPNLKDYHPLNQRYSQALPRYYVIQDADYASQKGSVSHLVASLVACEMHANEGSARIQHITNKPFVAENIWDPGNFIPQVPLSITAIPIIKHRSMYLLIRPLQHQLLAPYTIQIPSVM
jgi:hypothetical protein